MDDLLRIFTSAAVSTVLVAALAFLLRKWLSERMGRSIAHEYDRKLEEFRDEIAQRDTIRSTATAALTATHVAGYGRTLQALEVIWAETVRLRDKLPLYAGHADLLLPDEYEEAVTTNPNFRGLIENVDEHAEAMDLYSDRTDVEIARAFAGEYAFSLFYAYRAFTGRVATLLPADFQQNGTVRCWHGDKALKELLATVLTPDELTQVEAAQTQRLRLVQQLVERKIVSHIGSVVSGELSANVNLEQAHRIVFAANSLGRKGGG
jgi:hypothetical protein